MQNNPSIQPITDSLLAQAIDRAQRRVCVIAPGIWEPVADAIAGAWRRLPPDQVSVILDIDPEVCRIGYGCLAAIEALQAAARGAGQMITQEPGVRICVFLIDDAVYIFSPTPRLVEAPPKEGAGAPVAGRLQANANGIILGAGGDALAKDMGVGPRGVLDRILGMDQMDEKKLGEVKQDLAANPPKNFDLTQVLSVYNAKVQFVELTVTGCRLSANVARLPKDMLPVLKGNPDLAEKVENSFRLLGSADILTVARGALGVGAKAEPEISEASIFGEREALEKKYLRPVKGIGMVIERSRKVEFEKELEALEGEVRSFSEGIKKDLQRYLEHTAKEITEAIFDDVRKNLPEGWKRDLGLDPDPERLRFYITERLLKSFGNAHQKVEKMKVSVIYKDVTYDMLTSGEFRAQMRRYFPDLEHLEEYNAAREREAGEPGLFS